MKKITPFLLVVIFVISLFIPHSSFSDEAEDINKKISEYSQKLEELKKAKNTLANQINIINSQIELTSLKISQTQVSIKTLKSDIADLTIKINDLDISLNKLSSLYIEQVSQNYKISKRYPQIALFTYANFNNILEQYKYLSTIQKNSQNTLVSLETVRTNYDAQKAEKTQKQKELQDLEAKLATQQSSLDKQKISKNNLLVITKNDENKYQQLLSEAISQLNALKSFANSAGGSTCLDSPPGGGSDGNFYSQRDPRWCKQTIGNSSDTVGAVGCYISSIAMTFKKLGYDINPSAYAANPSNFRFNTAYAVSPIPPSGYTYKQTSYSSSIVDNELRNGRYVIAQIKMSGSIYGMHFIVIISGSNGNYKIHDPWYGSDLDLNQHYNTSLIMSLRLITK